MHLIWVVDPEIRTGPNTSKRHPKHPVHPYLLSNLTINRSYRVWQSKLHTPFFESDSAQHVESFGFGGYPNL